MSLDLTLEIDGGGGHYHEVWTRNITHDVWKMWEKAGVRDAFYESDGHIAEEYIEALGSGLRHFVEHYPEYEKLNSSNGWAMAENALPWLFNAYRAFAANPKARIRVYK